MWKPRNLALGVKLWFLHPQNHRGTKGNNNRKILKDKNRNITGEIYVTVRGAQTAFAEKH
jgi:hypothetical protein